MTSKLFWVDPYLRTCDTRVTTVSGPIVTLQETIFYAFSGGQESDHGTISGYPVSEARKEGLEILYRLPTDHALQSGDPVRVEIDWERRYRLMRLHFAAELVLELVYRMFPGINKKGAHISPEKARIDFAWHENLAPHLQGIQRDARKLVQRNLEITNTFSDIANEQRTWEISGFACVPCGGTHLHRTGEVGPMTLRRENPGRGLERIEVRIANV